MYSNFSAFCTFSRFYITFKPLWVNLRSARGQCRNTRLKLCYSSPVFFFLSSLFERIIFPGHGFVLGIKTKIVWGKNYVLYVASSGNLTFKCPCIANNIRSEQPTRCNVSQFICFCKTLHMFKTACPSIIRTSKLHIQRQVFVRPILDSVCAVLSSW